MKATNEHHKWKKNGHELRKKHVHEELTIHPCPPPPPNTTPLTTAGNEYLAPFCAKITWKKHKLPQQLEK